jgi:hypothetical protein
VETKSTGSLGSGSRIATWEALGEQDWEGRRVVGLTSGREFYLYFDASRRIVAQVRDGKPVQTYDPYEALYDWPLFVGKSWVSEFRIRDHAREQTVALKYNFQVEAFEEIPTPAGAFKAFRIRRDGPDDRYIVWFNPELAVEVKRVWERFSSHRLGAGTNDMEFVFTGSRDDTWDHMNSWVISRVLAEATSNFAVQRTGARDARPGR